MTASEAAPAPWEIWHARFNFDDHGYKFRPVLVLACSPDGLLAAMMGYRTFRVAGGLVPGVVVGGGVVEFVPANCVAPAGDDGGGLMGLTGLVPGIFEGCVGGHGRQDCRCWLRVG